MRQRRHGQALCYSRPLREDRCDLRYVVNRCIDTCQQSFGIGEEKSLVGGKFGSERGNRYIDRRLIEGPKAFSCLLDQLSCSAKVRQRGERGGGKRDNPLGYAV